MKKNLLIVPARGGSKGIPRKNLRYLAGVPLIGHVLNTASNLNNNWILSVNTDDKEIADYVINNHPNWEVYKRPAALGNDYSTIDEVIEEELNSRKLESLIVVVIQPTSPFIKLKSIEDCINKVINDHSINSLITVSEFKHLLWKKTDNGNYLVQSARVNRQKMEPLYMENGAITVSRYFVHKPFKRLAEPNILYELPEEESLDIDNHDDWLKAERKLSGDTIYFAVRGNNLVGMGHIYNAIEITRHFASYSFKFIVLKEDQLALLFLKTLNYPVEIIDTFDNLTKIVPKRSFLILDILDTKANLINSLISNNLKILSFEDRNVMRIKNRLVINAIYDGESNEYVKYGHKYFILRKEFLRKQLKVQLKAKSCVLAFGGSDPKNYTKTVLMELKKNFQHLNVTVILGKGYLHNKKEIKKFSDKLLENITNIQDEFMINDFAVTSAGRTCYELAAVGLPAIVLNQNSRELEHNFPTHKNGFIRHKELDLDDLSLKQYVSEILKFKTRENLNKKMSNINFDNNTTNTIKLVHNFLLK